MAPEAACVQIWCKCGAFAPYFLDFSLAPLVEDGSPGDVQKCEIYARHAQFRVPLLLHVVIPRAWAREFSLSSSMCSFSDTDI
jgi:hypothetical protein